MKSMDWDNIDTSMKSPPANSDLWSQYVNQSEFQCFFGNAASTSTIIQLNPI